MKNRKLAYYLIFLLILFLVSGVITGIYYWRNYKLVKIDEQASIIDILEQNVEVCIQVRKIDGLCYSGETEPGVYAVMIENQTESRPPSGLAEASLVYEAIVEAPITRFLAVFSLDKNIEKIGPVRSARPFYVDWAKEFDGPYVHVGGSDEALNLLDKIYKYDLNEFSAGGYFWRAWTRRAPHNVYTSSELIQRAMENRNWEVENDFLSWQFKPEAEYSERGNTETIKIDYATYDYSVEWVYDKDNNIYKRFMAGSAHEDDNGEQIVAKNLAIIYTDSTVIDDYGRRKTRTIGSGEAIVFIDGQTIKGTWKRPTLENRTKFYDESMNEISFNGGTTWLEVIPSHYPKVVVQENLGIISE